ncbi:MAG: hypothetical protein CMJ77_11025 [Planctomycetaceae bacterium]|nr:hypothetical protein [Planctomycetaceae bacterium]
MVKNPNRFGINLIGAAQIRSQNGGRAGCAFPKLPRSNEFGKIAKLLQPPRVSFVGGLWIT